METYIVKVNGEEFEVEIEKKSGSSAPSAAPAAPSEAAPKRSGVKPAGEPVVCGTAGSVYKIICHAGEKVRSGDTIIVLEAMKMEIPVVSPKDGTVSRILVSEGESTASGQTVAYVE